MEHHQVPQVPVVHREPSHLRVPSVIEFVDEEVVVQPTQVPTVPPHPSESSRLRGEGYGHVDPSPDPETRTVRLRSPTAREQTPGVVTRPWVAPRGEEPQDRDEDLVSRSGTSLPEPPSTG